MRWKMTMHCDRWRCRNSNPSQNYPFDRAVLIIYFYSKNSPTLNFQHKYCSLHRGATWSIRRFFCLFKNWNWYGRECCDLEYPPAKNLEFFQRHFKTQITILFISCFWIYIVPWQHQSWQSIITFNNTHQNHRKTPLISPCVNQI